AFGLAAPRDSGRTVESVLGGRRAAPAHLLLQPRRERLGVDLLRRQNPCRSRDFFRPAGHARIIAGACYGIASGPDRLSACWATVTNTGMLTSTASSIRRSSARRRGSAPFRSASPS